MEHMKLFMLFLILVASIITVYLLVFEKSLSGDILVRVGVGLNTLLVKKTESPEVDSCPTVPVARADPYGRLANQLSIYVNHIALEREYGYHLYLSKPFYLNLQKLVDNITVPIMDTTMVETCNITFWPRARVWDTFTKYLEREKTKCQGEKKEHIDANNFVETCLKDSEKDSMYININQGAVTKPDWDLLKKHLLYLKQNHLKFNKKLQNRIYSVLQEYRSSFSQQDLIFIGVHVRRTDWYKAVSPRFGAKMLEEKKYYLAGVSYYQKKFPENVLFLVFSDDMEWCRKNLDHPSIVFPGGKSPEEDLSLLSSLNHTLIGYGSYGLWGGFLAGGEVVVPESLKQFPGTASETAPRMWNWTYLPGF